MNSFFSRYYKGISLVIFIGFATIAINSMLFKDNSLSHIFQLTLASKLSNTSAINLKNQSKENIIVEAAGHFANNQLKDGTVQWIQGGLWNLKIKTVNEDNISNTENTGSPNMKAIFSANFTMIKPDGSLSHNHNINNFTSNNVIFAGNDIIITGIADIHSNIGLEFKQVPLTVHLMGKKVLGLMINVKKTNGHFASPNEMFGTLISGLGLDTKNNINNNMNMSNMDMTKK
ncbi:MAG TPA: hypothetical protein VIY08_02395 [Candidatus Nitrosocosmicus sp.]